MKILLLLLAPALLAQNLSLSVPNGTITEPGTNFSLNLNLTMPEGSESPAGIQFDLTYPAADVTMLSVSDGPAATAAGKTFTCAPSSGHVICVLAGINTNKMANGVIGVVSITTSSAPTSIPITLGNTLGASLAGDGIALSASGITLSNFSRFDLNQDGKIDIKDLQLLILKVLAQMSASLTGSPDVRDVQKLIARIPAP